MRGVYDEVLGGGDGGDIIDVLDVPGVNTVRPCRQWWKAMKNDKREMGGVIFLDP